MTHRGSEASIRKTNLQPHVQELPDHIHVLDSLYGYLQGPSGEKRVSCLGIHHHFEFDITEFYLKRLVRTFVDSLCLGPMLLTRSFPVGIRSQRDSVQPDGIPFDIQKIGLPGRFAACRHFGLHLFAH